MRVSVLSRCALVQANATASAHIPLDFANLRFLSKGAFRTIGEPMTFDHGNETLGKQYQILNLSNLTASQSGMFQLETNHLFYIIASSQTIKLK